MNGGVGTKQGQAFIYDRSHNLHIEGTQRPVNAYLGQLDQERKAKAVAKQQKQKEDDAWRQAMQGIGDQEYWYRHDEVIQSELNAVYEMGADLRAAGVSNPAVGTDAGSREWQKKYTQLMAMTQTSRQLKEVEKNFMDELGTQGDKKKYTPNSIGGFKSYLYDVPLDQHMTNNLPTPMLMLEEPGFIQYDQDLADRKKLKDGGVDVDNLSETDFINIATRTLETPETAQATISAIAAMTPEAQQALRAKAAERGMEPAVFLRTLQLAPIYRGKKDEFDFYAYIDQAKPSADKWGSSDGVRTTQGTSVRDREMKISVDVALGDANFVRQSYMQGRFGAVDPDASLEEMREAGRKTLPDIFASRVQTGSTTRVDLPSGNEGFGDADYIRQREKWLSDIKSGDETRMMRAAGYLRGVQTDTGETINYATTMNRRNTLKDGDVIIDPSTGEETVWNYGDEIPEDNAVIRFAAVEELTASRPGAKPKNMTTLFEINPDMDQEHLYSYYDRAFNSKDKGKTPYLAGDLIRGATDPTATQTPAGLVPAGTASPQTATPNPTRVGSILGRNRKK